MARIRSGSSNTYMIDVKYLNPDDYFSGKDKSDNHRMYAGDDRDSHAWTADPPLPDRACVRVHLRFGSAHAGGCDMAMCDGSLRTISFSIDPEMHRRPGSRVGTPQSKFE